MPRAKDFKGKELRFAVDKEMKELMEQACIELGFDSPSALAKNFVNSCLPAYVAHQRAIKQQMFAVPQFVYPGQPVAQPPQPPPQYATQPPAYQQTPPLQPPPTQPPAPSQNSDRNGHNSEAQPQRPKKRLTDLM